MKKQSLNDEEIDNRNKMLTYEKEIKKFKVHNNIKDISIKIIILFLLFSIFIIINGSLLREKINIKDKNNKINKYPIKSLSSGMNDLILSVQQIKKNLIQPKKLSYKILKILFYLSPKKVVGKEKIRIGEKYDGGYVMINDFSAGKIAYSFGIKNIIKWDFDMTKKGYDVYMYDHTIKNLPYENKKFHWKKIGICSTSKRKKHLKTLKELLLENGHKDEKHMILKIDVEGEEERIIIDTEEEILKQFDQIILEYHHIKDIKNPIWYEKVIKALEKINKSHQLYHIHSCYCFNHVFVDGISIPKIIEVSYIKREGNKFVNDYSFYPINGLDAPVCRKIPEHLLGFLGIFGIENEIKFY